MYEWDDAITINTVEAAKEKYVKLSSNNHFIFGQMPDWNPAEIIGQTPSRLSYSLYKKLITRDIWYLGRKNLLYSDLDDQELMVSLAGHPYIDVTKSFKSFIPKTIPEKLNHKLIKQFQERLINSPHLHDKIEFSVCITCFDFSLMDLLNKDFNENFSAEELKTVYQSYFEHFKKIVFSWESIIEKNETRINKLLAYLDDCKKQDNQIENLNTSIEVLRQFGTLVFSELARLGFIGSILLKSLTDKNVITPSEAQMLLTSKDTVTSEFLRDLTSNDISEKDFNKSMAISAQILTI